MKAIASVIILAALAAPSAADSFPELRTKDRAWTYEVVVGRSVTSLKPAKDAPPVKGVVSDVKIVGAHARVLFDLAGVANLGKYRLGDNMHLWLSVGDDELRQSAVMRDDDDALSDPANARGFTFPAAVPKAWKVKRKTRYGSITIAVKPGKMKLGGKDTPVWIAESTQDDGQEKRYELAAYAPGVGPALICDSSYDAPSQRTWLCVRLVAEGAPAAAAPAK